MNSRRASSQRTRNWSTEATSTAEGSSSCMGSQVQHPIREPRIPPTELRAQKDQGFAHFLKKHASPTHKRVTAGGRIVPMEPRHAPPVFGLGYSRPNKSESRNESPAYGGSNYTVSRVTSENLYKVHTYATQPELFDRASEQDKAQYRSDIDHTRQPTNLDAPLMQDSAAVVSPHLFGMVPTTLVPFASPAPTMTSFGGVTSYGCGLESTHAMYNYASQVFPSDPCISVQGPYVNQNWDHQQRFPQQEMIGYQASAQSSLSYWTQYFTELDRQLKALDRQRATTTLTPAYAEQRRHIVQQRADTKAIINKLEDFLGLSEKAVQASHAVFNVDAPSYVPMIKQPQESQQMNIPAPALRAAEANVLSSATSNDKPQLPGGKRPIPIVPPPGTNKQVSPTVPSSYKSPLHDEVDDWGVKVGKAPPALERQQSSMLECLVESISSTSSRSSIKADLHISLPQKSFSENDANARRAEADDSSENDEDWTLSKAGRAPPHVEAAYELHLDALRQPKGVTTVVHLPEGSPMEVEGQDLQRPPTLGMSAFEREYWSRKPSIVVSSDSSGSEHNEASAMTPLSHDTTHTGEHEDANKENVTVTPLFHRKAATNAFLAQFNENVTSSLPSPQNDTQSLRDLGLAQNDRNRQILQDIYGSNEHGCVDIIEDQPKLYGEYSGHPSNMPPSQTNHNIQRQDMLVEQDMSIESMYNKGYSSVSIQNIHALAHLPQNMDGSNDDGKGAKALLGIAKKAKSPRLLQRSAVNGGAWFGPFRRDHTNSEGYSPVRSPKY